MFRHFAKQLPRISKISKPSATFTKSFSQHNNSNGSTQEKFLRAVNVLKQPSTDSSPTPSNETKLKLYAFFKQAELGACSGSRPNVFDMVARAKFDAWKALGTMSKEEAMNLYIKEVEGIFGGNLPAETKQPPATIPHTPPTQHISSHYYQPPPKFLDILSPRTTSSEQPVQWDMLKKIAVSVDEATKVASVQLNRPTRGNAFDVEMWYECAAAFRMLSNHHPTARCVVLTGNGGNFSSGMDLTVFMEMQKLSTNEPCEARKREGLLRFIDFLQECVTSLEKCSFPVIAAVRGHCIGGAIDLICAADIRYCTKDAKFCIKETDLAIVADMGTLQRLPKLIGHQAAAELTYTSRTFTGQEAKELGLVLKCFDTEEEMMREVKKTAETIAAKSPITVRGVKEALLYTRDHSVKDSLQQVRYWNSAMLNSEDLLQSAMSMMNKTKPTFKDP